MTLQQLEINILLATFSEHKKNTYPTIIRF